MVERVNTVLAIESVRNCIVSDSHLLLSIQNFCAGNAILVASLAIQHVDNYSDGVSIC